MDPQMAAATLNSPCGACKFLRRKCQPECVFAAHFPPDQPQKFAAVHRIYGASHVAKLLNELHPMQREDAVSSLAYEAEMRLRDPVYGCVGVITVLQHQLRRLQADLSSAKSQLSGYHQLHRQQLARIGHGGGDQKVGMQLIRSSDAAMIAPASGGQIQMPTAVAGDDRRSAFGPS